MYVISWKRGCVYYNKQRCSFQTKGYCGKMAKHEKIILLIARLWYCLFPAFAGRQAVLRQCLDNRGKNYRIRFTRLSASATASPPPETAAVIVNINTATADELAELDGIGSTLAERIVAYRETNGAFRVPEQLMNVEGIGEIKFNSIKNYITVN